MAAGGGAEMRRDRRPINGRASWPPPTTIGDDNDGLSKSSTQLSHHSGKDDRNVEKLSEKNGEKIRININEPY